VAQVQANRDDFGDRVQTLRVVNPSSSLLANVAARPSTAPAAPSTPPPVLRTNTADTIVLRPAPTRPRLDPSPLSQRAIDGLPPASAETKAIKFAPSLETLERTAAASIYFEQLYHGILKLPRARDQRLNQLEAALRSLPDAERRAARAAWAVAETEYLREIRAKVSVGSFAKLKTVGAGAFGVVNLVREQGTGELFAMKQLSKDFMLRKSQEGHVRAERDFLAQASHTTRWIVRLAYSFQDADNLYLVLESVSLAPPYGMLIAEQMDGRRRHAELAH
jgi:protein-serine/threonine kinase